VKRKDGVYRVEKRVEDSVYRTNRKKELGFTG